jgi:hypothetical protein
MKNNSLGERESGCQGEHMRGNSFGLTAQSLSYFDEEQFARERESECQGAYMRSDSFGLTGDPARFAAGLRQQSPQDGGKTRRRIESHLRPTAG